MWLVAVVVFGAAWLYGVFKAGDELRPLVAWAGGAAALTLCATIAVAAYYAALAARVRESVRSETGGAASLERQIAEVADSTLPALLHRVGSGAPADTALGEILPPADPALRRVLQITALDAAARQREAASALAVVDGLDREVDRLVGEAMPVIVERIRRDRAGPETLLPEVGEPESPQLRRLLARVVDDLATGERGSAAAMMSCANAAARIQAACTRLLGDLRDLEHRYGDDPVFHDLLDIDHEVSQAGRIADSIALLAGGRSGRRWTKPIVMESILRGAMGRIHDYRRVKLHFTTTSAIAGYAAEGVMHCLAELMDNAASFSAANTDVHVYVEEEDAGIVVTIEDSGLGMRQRERARAERLVNEPSDLTALPGTRLGLAVVGRLAAKHALRISFRPSSRGGTAAIVLVPRQLVTQPRQDLLPPELREPWDGSSRPPLAGTGLPTDLPRGLDTAPDTPEELLSAASTMPPPPAEPSRAPLPTAPLPTAPLSSAPLSTEASEADDAFDLPQRRRGETLRASPDPVMAEVGRGDGRPAPGQRFAAFRSATGGPRTVARDTGGLQAPEPPTPAPAPDGTPPHDQPHDLQHDQPHDQPHDQASTQVTAPLDEALTHDAEPSTHTESPTHDESSAHDETDGGSPAHGETSVEDGAPVAEGGADGRASSASGGGASTPPDAPAPEPDRERS
ncbi:sensor histidine kinase [Actinomadura harenae]|uniref:histidine kinase n=1 Tax=Actinomadura harenae TaxID=2483351 RepID=A0A3M2MAM1_9ACTN|nr:sensor histidine kinase [Actinomadura harenae]